MNALRLARPALCSISRRAATPISRPSRVCTRVLASRLYATKAPTREAAEVSAEREEFGEEEFLQYKPEFDEAERVERDVKAGEAQAEVEEKEALEGAALGTTGPGNSSQKFPDLMTYEPLLDSRQILDFAPSKSNPYGARVIIRNDTDGLSSGSTMFEEDRERRGLFTGANHTPMKSDLHEEGLSTDFLALQKSQVAGLHKYPLVKRRVVQQSAKGRIVRMYCMMVVGDGNGLVGMGEAKAHDMATCMQRAFMLAVGNMDYVERFEGRTVWTDMETKMGSTRIVLRPRPVGFGLRCNPNLHQVFQAAGIKDVSAKTWGSRNPINVIKAAFRMLQAGDRKSVV